MRKTGFGAITSLALLSLGFAGGPEAQQSAMTFFVTSVGSGKGADLGGLAGADRHCQSLWPSRTSASPSLRSWVVMSAASPLHASAVMSPARGRP